MTQHRKLKNKQHEPHQKLGVISGAPQGEPANRQKIYNNHSLLIQIKNFIFKSKP